MAIGPFPKNRQPSSYNHAVVGARGGTPFAPSTPGWVDKSAGGRRNPKTLHDSGNASYESADEICYECFECGHRRPDCPWRDRKVGDPNYLNASKRNYSKLHRLQKEYLAKIGRAPHFALVESIEITNSAGQHVQNGNSPRLPTKEEMDKESKN